MPKINFKEQVLPHIIAVLVFLLVTVAYFKPVFFDNQQLSQHDILQWKGGAKELLDYREQNGDEALWTNSMFSGMPGYLITTQWGVGIMSTIQRVISVGLPHPVKVVFLSFLGFYIMLVVFGVRPYLAIAGALAFGLSSYNIIGISAGHNARIAAIAYMPMVLAGVHLAFTRSKLSGAALTALALSLELHAGHLQITYYLALIIIVYLVAQGISAIKHKQIEQYIKTGIVLFLAAVVALGTFIGSIMSTLEYSKYSIRGKSEITQIDPEDNPEGLPKTYAFQYSNSILEPMTLMIPNIFGGGTGDLLFMDEGSETRKVLQKAQNPQEANMLASYARAYWGQQSNAAPYYAGAIIIFLFALGVMYIDRKILAWTIPMIVLGIMLSWGSNFSSFNYFMFDYFPGYNKFRSVTFALIIPIMLINLVGFVGLEKFIKQGLDKKALKNFFIAFGVTGGLSLLLIMIAGIFSYKGLFDDQLPVWLTNAMADDRKGLLRADAFRSFMFILLAAGTIYAGLKNKINITVASIGLIALVLIDLWTVDKRFLDDSKFTRNPIRAHFTPTDADNYILSDKDLSFRVFDLINPWNDARTSYHHKSIGGYHGAKIRRYQDLISKHLVPEQSQIISELRESGRLSSSFQVTNMLNTKYFVAGASAQAVIPNADANGNAWLVKNIQLAANPDEEINALSQIDTKSTAVIDQSKFDGISTVYNGTGSVKLTSYQPNQIKYQANLSDNAFVVFSEIYYPEGWQATIDGNPIEIIRANYVLRGLEVPSGSHEIVFEFKPSVYSYGNLSSTISSIIVLLLVIGAILVELKVIKLKS
ncbi:MAG: YfhO family protein [Bacteroidota bacterium]